MNIISCTTIKQFGSFRKGIDHSTVPKTMALARKLCSGSFSRTLLSAGSSSHGGARALSSALAESYYNDEQKEMMATTRKLIEAEINPVQFESVKRKDIKCVKQ